MKTQNCVPVTSSCLRCGSGGEVLAKNISSHLKVERQGSGETCREGETEERQRECGEGSRDKGTDGRTVEGVTEDSPAHVCLLADWKEHDSTTLGSTQLT